MVHLHALCCDLVYAYMYAGHLVHFEGIQLIYLCVLGVFYLNWAVAEVLVCGRTCMVLGDSLQHLTHLLLLAVKMDFQLFC